MKCPKCSFAESEVINSRDREAGEATYRRRRCGFCAHRWSTIERTAKPPFNADPDLPLGTVEIRDGSGNVILQGFYTARRPVVPS